jgi:hypothetical protein
VTITGPTFETGTARPLFQYHRAGGYSWCYDVSPDGKRFLVAQEPVAKEPTNITLVSAWPRALER